MTSKAARLLAEAKRDIDRGESFYRKAAEEIVAAMNDDSTLSLREIGRRLDRSDKWVGDLVRWHTNAKGSSQATPYSGKEHADRKDAEKTRRVLREAPAEQIAEMLSEPEVRRKVAEAQVIATRQHEPLRGPISLPVAGPSFIDFIVRISSALIALESVVASWDTPTAIPAEFSASSFDDIAEKAMRIKDHVNALRSDDNDAFQDIVRNFRESISGS